MMTDLSPAQLTAIERKICTLCGPAPALEHYQPFPFARDDNHAFTLVDELVREGRETTIKRFYGSDLWWCILARPYKQHYEANDKSRPVAICLAYLEARGVDVEKLLEEAE